MSHGKRAKTSDLWNFFEPVDSHFAICTICRVKLSYKTTTSNLKKHLSCKHSEAVRLRGAKGIILSTVNIKEEMNVPTIHINLHPDVSNDEEALSPSIFEIKEESIEMDASDPFEQHCPSTSCSYQSQKNVEATISMTSPFEHSMINNSTFNERSLKEMKRKVENNLGRLFAKGLYPFSLIENSAFREFVSGLNSNYHLPTKDIISKTLLPSLYEKCLGDMRDIVNKGRKYCITTDCWLSFQKITYIEVTAHFLDENYKINSILLECSPSQQTTESVANKLKRIVSDWKICDDDILLAISSDTAVVKDAIIELRWKHFGCFAHSINLIVSNALTGIGIERLIARVRAIVIGFNSESIWNAVSIDENKTENTPLELLHDIPSLWISTIHMLQRFLTLKDLVIIISLNKNINTILTISEWKTIQELCQILEHFEDVTKIISSQLYCTASIVIPLVNGLKDLCSNLTQKICTPPAQSVLCKLQTGLSEQFSIIEQIDIMAVCTFLDPRFKLIAFSDESAVKNAEHLVVAAIEELTEKQREVEKTPEQNDADTLSVWSALDKCIAITKPHGTRRSQAVLEVRRYLEEETIPRSDDPLKWWQEHKPFYPHLAEIAREQLCIQASCIPCERIFSEAGFELREKRNNLNMREVNLLPFLNANLNFDNIC